MKTCIDGGFFVLRFVDMIKLKCVKIKLLMPSTLPRLQKKKEVCLVSLIFIEFHLVDLVVLIHHDITFLILWDVLLYTLKALDKLQTTNSDKKISVQIVQKALKVYIPSIIVSFSISSYEPKIVSFELWTWKGEKN